MPEEEPEEVEEEEEAERFAGLSSLFPSHPSSLDRFSFCFHARRPEGDALKPGCNPGDAIK